MSHSVGGIIVAGGLARRMGGLDKPLMEVGGQSLLARTLDRLTPQAGPVLLNANGDPARFAAFGLEVRGDSVPGHAGPLAGILTGLEWARERGLEWVISAAADTPLLPPDLVERLDRARRAEGARMAVARSGGRLHPLFTLWPVAVAEDLRRALVEEDQRKMETFLSRHSLARVDWPVEPFDPFFNVNTPADMEMLKRMI